MGDQLVSSLSQKVKLHSPVGVRTKMELKGSTRAIPQKPLPPRPAQNKLAKHPEWRTAHFNPQGENPPGEARVVPVRERGSELTYQSALGQVSSLHRASVSPSVKWLLKFDDL